MKCAWWMVSGRDTTRYGIEVRAAGRAHPASFATSTCSRGQFPTMYPSPSFTIDNPPLSPGGGSSRCEAVTAPPTPVRCAFRNRNHPDNRNNNIGFRCAQQFVSPAQMRRGPRTRRPGHQENCRSAPGPATGWAEHRRALPPVVGPADAWGRALFRVETCHGA